MGPMGLPSRSTIAHLYILIKSFYHLAVKKRSSLSDYSTYHG